VLVGRQRFTAMPPSPTGAPGGVSACSSPGRSPGFAWALAGRGGFPLHLNRPCHPQGNSIGFRRSAKTAREFRVPAGRQEQTFGRGGGIRSDRAVNRTATFVFLIGDRFFDTVTAFVPGAGAAGYEFTSALAVQILKHLAPQLTPLLRG
jgi:hypothetical protein